MATDKPTTTDTLKTDADPEPTSTKSVNLTSPDGTKVTASQDAAKKLKEQGWK
jgi:hypothetical protein